MRWAWAAMVCAVLAMGQEDGASQGLKRAVELHEAGRFAEAIPAYEAFLKVHPEAAAVRSNLGAALAREGRFAEAIRQYKLALEAQPGNYGVRFNLALAHYKSGDVVQATREFEAVLAVIPATHPQSKAVTLLLAECYLREDSNQRVVALLDPLATADPNDLAAAYLLGNALLRLGQEERGSQMIQRILGRGDSAEAHMLMAYTRVKANDNLGAMKEVDRAIELNPSLPEAYGLRGRLAFSVSELPAAEAAFRRAIELDPNAFEPLLLLGTILRQQARLEESRKLLDRAIRLRPKEVRVRYQSGVLATAEGDDERAVAMLEDLIKDVPEYIEAHRTLAAAYFRMGRAADGRRARDTAEKLNEAAGVRDREIGKTLK